MSEANSKNRSLTQLPFNLKGFDNNCETFRDLSALTLIFSLAKH